MNTLNIEINCDNLSPADLAGILEELSADCERDRPLCRVLYDSAGNMRGNAYFTD